MSALSSQILKLTIYSYNFQLKFKLEIPRAGLRIPKRCHKFLYFIQNVYIEKDVTYEKR